MKGWCQQVPRALVARARERRHGTRGSEASRKAARELARGGSYLNRRAAKEERRSELSSLQVSASG